MICPRCRAHVPGYPERSGDEYVICPRCSRPIYLDMNIHPCPICGSRSPPEPEMRYLSMEPVKDCHVVYICPDCGYEEV